MNSETLKNIIECALLAAGEPLSIRRILQLFSEDEKPEEKAVRACLHELCEEYSNRGLECREFASGYRVQVRQEYGHWISRLWEQKPPRYSRAFLETLALIAYRQPITRAQIEEIRGVSVSSSIIKTLIDRAWIKIIGHKEAPGKPAIYGTTKQFLDDFNLKSLKELPNLMHSPELTEVDISTQKSPPLQLKLSKNDNSIEQSTEA